MKKRLTILFLLIVIQLYSQDYLNIHYTDTLYKHSLVSEISEITFNASGTEITVTKTDASSTTDDFSTVAENNVR